MLEMLLNSCTRKVEEKRCRFNLFYGVHSVYQPSLLRCIMKSSLFIALSHLQPSQNSMSLCTVYARNSNQPQFQRIFCRFSLGAFHNQSKFSLQHPIFMIVKPRKFFFLFSSLHSTGQDKCVSLKSLDKRKIFRKTTLELIFCTVSGLNNTRKKFFEELRCVTSLAVKSQHGLKVCFGQKLRR